MESDSQRVAFLNAIAATPLDDLPRLVYADWLDESGRSADSARALFIRGQIALERMDRESPSYPWAYFDLYSKVCAAADGHLRAWMKELPPAVAIELKRQPIRVNVFRRGFLERVRVHPKTFARCATELFAVAPVREVHFELDEESAQTLFTRPELLRLSAVRLTRRNAWPRRWGISAVAKCPYLTNLLELDLSSCGLDDHDAQALSRAKELKSLHTLKLSGNRLTYSGVVALAQSIDLEHVRRIELDGNGRLNGWQDELKRWFSDRLVF